MDAKTKKALSNRRIHHDEFIRAIVIAALGRHIPIGVSEIRALFVIKFVNVEPHETTVVFEEVKETANDGGAGTSGGYTKIFPRPVPLKSDAATNLVPSAEHATEVQRFVGPEGDQFVPIRRETIGPPQIS